MSEHAKKRKHSETAMQATSSQLGQNIRTPADAPSSALSKARRCIANLKAVADPLAAVPLVKRNVKGILEACKSEDNLDEVAREGVVGLVIPLLKALNGGDEAAAAPPGAPGVEEVERDICFVLGLLAIKVEHQAEICAAGTLPTLVAMVKRYAARDGGALAGVPAQCCRRAADAITNLAHENNAVKSRVRQEGGVPPLVALLRCADPKVQRAAAGSLRTLAFKNDENKAQIVGLDALPLLVQMLHSEDSTIHYEAVGVVGNLVHSSPAIKARVLAEGALQAVIGLLSSHCADSQREAALLLGQFATADGDYKAKIVQRGAVPPLVEMLAADDPQLREMAAFALGRLAQHYDNQAGIVAAGGLGPLLALLESPVGNLQHNAAFALYGLSDNEDNLVHFVRDGGVQRLLDAKLEVQASRDCVAKTLRRLQERLQGRVLWQVLYISQSAAEGGEGRELRHRVATALCELVTPESPRPADLHAMLFGRRVLDHVLAAVTEVRASAGPGPQRQAARALLALARAVGVAGEIRVEPDAPPEPNVFLGEKFVNSPTLSDVTFVVEGRPFHAHRIALLACSDIFRSMFEGHYREKDAATIPIPNIRWEVFEAMMTCVYTGRLEVQPAQAQELLEAADQYMLDPLKRLCEAAIAARLAPDNVSSAFDLAEQFNAPQLARACALYCLEHYAAMVRPEGAEPAPSAADGGGDADGDDERPAPPSPLSPDSAKDLHARTAARAAAFAGIVRKMAPRLRAALQEEVERRRDAEEGRMSP